MGVLADRINGWVEDRRKTWGDALGTWLLDRISGGITGFLEQNEPEAVELIDQVLAQLEQDPNVPAPLLHLIREVRAARKPIPVILAIAIGIILFLPTVTSIVQPLGNVIRYKQERVFNTYRFDPGVVANIIRRFAEKHPWIRDDLEDQGFDKRHIEALMDATLFYPGAQDLVMWLAREVFEEDARQKYGLDDEADKIDFSMFDKAGISQDQALNYWRAHWQHPSFMQMMELLHRGLLTATGEAPGEPATPADWERRDQEGTKEMYEWYRLVEVPPHWRNLLTESLWNVPTRVDVRRWWDMRVISEQELYSIYHRQGYRGKDLEKYVLWTKVYTDFPSLMARWTNGWITEQDVRARLSELGMPADRVEEMIQEKVKPEKPARVEKERDLTATDIIMGVKKAVISYDQGVDLLMDLGYDREEAIFKLETRLAAAAGSPETFEEFKDLTTKWRQAVGKEVVPLPQELKTAAQKVLELTDQVEALRNEVKAEESKLISDEELPREATERLDDLRVKLNRAVAKLQAARSHYQALKAEFKQTTPE